MWVLAVLLGVGQPALRAATQGSVERALFTTTIADREPQDRVLVLANDVEQIYFYTELRHLQGRTISHRWEYEGQVVAEVPFEVKGPRWRVYSSKTLAPGQLGKWRVIVTDEQGWPLKAGVFHYVAATADGGPPAVILPPGDD